jgi:threonine dehydrogenase-like Zn-dependent dehydrogenase
LLIEKYVKEIKAKMKKIVSTGPRTSEIQEVDFPGMNDDQILIRQKYVGVCMSEHYDWSTAAPGVSFGHEPMGVIEKVGKNVVGYEVGDRVSGMWGDTLPGAGGMTEYAIGEPGSLYSTMIKLPDHIRDEDLVVEPLACMMSAVTKVKRFVPGTKICVVGCGYMGCGAISLLKLRGAYVVAVDTRAESLADAKKYGANEIYFPDDAARAYVPKGLGDSNAGFEIVMEWGETNESLDSAINLTKMCGQLCIGAYHTGGKRFVDMQQLNLKAIDCLSVHPRERDLLNECAENVVKLIGDGIWEYKGLPTKIYPMNKFDLAQSELESKYGAYMKSLIDMTWEDGDPYIV